MFDVWSSGNVELKAYFSVIFGKEGRLQSMDGWSYIEDIGFMYPRKKEMNAWF